ncbi:MAG: acyltransferase, partial [Actinomycetota bacterium]
MPRPVDARETYLPGLDGVRAIAVAVVVGYHLGIAKLSGGLLGVGIFFTLSGFLITSILLRSWRQQGNLGLGTFWLRRARRLLPALILVLVVVLGATALFSPSHFTNRAGDALAAMFYVSNWTTIINGISYFSLFSPPGPLDHLWSLAVEEQFYLLWPLLLLGMLSLAKGKIARVVLATSVLAALSFIALALLSHVGLDNTRAYEGTDTRAGGLLVGAVLAMVWAPTARAKSITVGARFLLDGAGIGALAVIAWLVVSTDQYSLSIYHGGLLLLSLATVVLLAVVVHPGSSMGRLLGISPLRWLGERSYGVYLWHLPIIVAFPKSFLASVPLVRDVFFVSLILAIASLSWRFVENPIRTLGFRGAGSAAVSLLRSSTKPALRIGATAGLLSVVLVSGVGAAQVMAVKTPPSKPLPSVSSTTTFPVTTTLTPQVQNLANKTSCKVVTFDGDSTSDGLISTSYLPNPADRIQARLFAVGVQSFHNEIAGA